MLIKIPRRWELPERCATPEAVYMDRRALLQAAGMGALIAAVAPLGARAQTASGSPETGYPAPRNERYKLDRPLSAEADVTTYNNFYEFGQSKDIVGPAQKLPLRPWTVTFDGLVEKPQTVDFDTLLKAMPLEERLYRHRCVEAWSMAVPWTGFPLARLVEFARPLSSATHVAVQTFDRKHHPAPGFRQAWYPWPYQEGLTMAEARHDLAFVATGLYGKPMLPQNGAPLRLALPWKYGFKSAKSLMRITFTDKQPSTYWEALQSSEYGFWANVNPQVAHPRWSQAKERVLGTGELVPTQLYNGYAEEVAGLYQGNNDPRLFM